MTIKIDNLEEFLKQKRDLQKSAKEKDMHMMFDFKKPRELVLVCHSMLDKQKFDPFRKLDDFAKIINSVVKKSVQEIPGDDEICFLCEQPMADKYRLLQCSHAFHLNCLKQKLEGVETSDDFICPIPDCFCRPHPGETPADEVEDRILEPENPVPAKPKRTGIVLYDILCLFTEPERELLFSKMKYQFLIQFKSRFRYCPTPNCDNILERVPRTLNPEGKDEPDNGIDRDKLFCTSCGNDTCFECGRSHFGEEQSCRKEKPSRQRKTNNRAKGGNDGKIVCPTEDCGQIISKVGPQGEASCDSCKVQFCTKCSNYESFQNKEHLMNHIGKVHGFV